MNPVELAQTTLAAPQGDMSFFALFLQAHLVVKLVMLGLVLASIWCWAIIVDKWLLFTRTKRQMNRFETVFWSGQSLEELYQHPFGRANHSMAACSSPRCASGSVAMKARARPSPACASASTG